MTPRIIEEIRERATELSNSRSHLVLKQTELEEKVDKWWEHGTEGEIDTLYELLEEAEDDLKWTEVTLEALEWVLGETDVRPEVQHEEERNNYAQATDSTGDG